MPACRWVSVAVSVFVATISTAGAADCTKSRPEAVVADVYLRSSGLTQAASKAQLSAALKALLDAQPNKAERVDLSHWSGVRPTVGDRLLVSDTLIEGRRASARVSFTAAERAASSPERLYAQVQLVREADGCWRVDDIVRDEASLRERLALTPPAAPASR